MLMACATDATYTNNNKRFTDDTRNEVQTSLRSGRSGQETNGMKKSKNAKSRYIKGSSGNTWEDVSASTSSLMFRTLQEKTLNDISDRKQAPRASKDDLRLDKSNWRDTLVLSHAPSTAPSGSFQPTQSRWPSTMPSTDMPSNVPSRSPSKMPSKVPSLVPTHFPTSEPSQNPTQSPTTCPNPVDCLRFQTSGNTGFFAIEECAASCDFDVQCKQGLVCYKRNRGQKSVPGCTGDADEIGNGDFNFCIKPPSNQLIILGYQGSPSNAYPLRECAGDCDTDADCGNGLFCFERNGSENVPGCVGSGQPQFDYCYNPGSNLQRLAFFGDIEYDYYELDQCEGDCDFDADCDIGLVCFQREGNDSGSVPSCIGNANTVGTGSDDFCIPRPSANTLISVYDNIEGGDAAAGGLYPIPSCAGDCDIDADCQGSLTCFFRAGFDNVPGCSGFGDEDYDYCI